MQHTATASIRIANAKPTANARRQATRAARPTAASSASAALKASAFLPSSAGLKAQSLVASKTAVPASRRPLKVSALTIQEEVVFIDTPTGPMHALVLRPTAPGNYPGLVFYSEIFQVTGPIRRSAAMMACHGFVVVVPDIYHEEEAAGSSLPYDGPGADRGNHLKVTKPMDAYDSDADAAMRYLMYHPACTGKVGVMGFCIGGHLAYRAALHPEVRAAAVWYPTDIHKGSPDHVMRRPAPNGGFMGSTCNTCHRTPEFAAKGTELLMIFGRQDPHIDAWGRKRIRQALMDADVCFSWHEYNGQHAFMRDEGYRYDAELAIECYQKAIALFRRKLNEGDLPVPSGQYVTAAVESRH
mmetsp:Transcript_20122/g.44052  ORF Transcript_20122/g.44052 Transcript_20122/m.44052 type:complete len:356 (-) Transcript_20122:335-1402(-)|eukprot:CAMPEP_0118935000 /NCGR_PEP_ID=MMETSP1169-20130426/14680_1 /TAXON_ID=36882 /ORGANISM="Pyramimonas obovata, Strain CCMP722" /LENGTH=355 /DNA_ID=CAMNT_0006877977 /DNA_START=56 /DNA_END=1123 /DNA_ORIENTATION=+